MEADRRAAPAGGPVVVHCRYTGSKRPRPRYSASTRPAYPQSSAFSSAGIGRTGCFIATTIGCRQLELEGVVDVLNITCQLRADR